MKPLRTVKKRKTELAFSVPPRLVCGAISVFEAYSLTTLGELFGHDHEWARDYFVRPIERNTKKRLIDPETGQPVPGVKHVKTGTVTLIRGEALIEWIKEHETQIVE